MTDAATAFDARHKMTSTLNDLGISPDPALISRLSTYTSLLLRWNRTYNLTGARNETMLVQEHLVDSLAAVPVLTAHLPRSTGNLPLLIDVGSGAGFPGIVIASVHPDWPIALVEPIGKKAAFLRQACAALRLPKVHPIGARLQDSESALSQITGTSLTERHFTCRAVATLTDLVNLIQPHVTANSRLFALKSRHLDEELTPFPEASVHLLKIPGFEHDRTVVELALNTSPICDSAAAPPAR